MRKLLRLAFGLFAFTLLWHPAEALAQKAATHCLGSLSQVSSRLYGDAVIALRSKTAVPLRLPTCVAGSHSNDGLYAIVKSANEDGYALVLGTPPDCEGQHVCSYGTMIGTSRPLNQIDEYDVTRRPGTLVKLTRGLTGYFYASVCA